MSKMLDIQPILDLAKVSPAGLPDPDALTKLLKERQEYKDAQDKSERLEEKVDQLYYLIKEIYNLQDGEFTLGQLFAACVAKYELRWTNNKNKTAERAAMQVAINLYQK